MQTLGWQPAAAESILIALAVAKTGDQEEVFREYKSGTGRKKTIDMLVGKQPSTIQGSFRTSMHLLAYWRDDAAHGMATPIAAPEANEALRQLLILALFVRKNWKELVGRP